jgi:hypothetical protein
LFSEPRKAILHKQDSPKVNISKSVLYSDKRTPVYLIQTATCDQPSTLNVKLLTLVARLPKRKSALYTALTIGRTYFLYKPSLGPKCTKRKLKYKVSQAI